MSSPTSNSGTPDKPGTTGKPGKKPKSAGFIESSQFKPTWLETGPLSPDMLPPVSPTVESTKRTADASSEYEERLAALERLYQDLEVDPNDSLDTGPRILLVTEQVQLAGPDVADIASPEQTDDEPPLPPEEDQEYVRLAAEAHALEEDVDLPVASAAIVTAEACSLPEAVVEPEVPAVPIETPDTPVELRETAPLPPLPEVTETAQAAPEPEIEPVVVAAVEETPAPETPVAESVAPEEAAEPTVAEAVAAPEAPVQSEAVDEAPTAAPVAEAAAVSAAPAPAPAVKKAKEPKPAPAKPAKPAKVKTRPKHKIFDRLAKVLLFAGLLCFGLALLTQYFNPLQRLALSTASLARPVSPSGLVAPAARGEWCVTGDFLAEGDALPRLVDDGGSGDLVASDRVYSLDYKLPSAGSYTWQVVNCADRSVVYPAAQSWITAAAAGEVVTFLFDSKERQDRLFFPIPFVVSAQDGARDYRVVGDFQNWDVNDTAGELRQIGPGLFQQVRKVAKPGDHQAYIIAGNEKLAVDAYGRTTEPIPFSFRTSKRGDYVVFLMDVNRGRASILYGMPAAVTALAYGRGFQIITFGLIGLGLLLMGWMLVRLFYMYRSGHWLEAGCPECGGHELMRIGRHDGDRVLNTVGFPVYRYQCRDCTWEGLKLSETGATISPRASAISKPAAGPTR